MMIGLNNIFVIKITLLIMLILPASFLYGQTQKVLVLHSYHQGLEWTDSISDGIKSILGSEKRDVEVYFDYLDSKRNSDKLYLNKLVELFRTKKQQTSFDLIITSDNDALEFMRMHGSELYPNTPVIFCGVNDFNNNLISGMSQVTGVIEQADIKATVALMLDVHPETRKILVFLDHSSTGLAIRKNVEAAEQYFKDKVEIAYYTDFSWSEVEQDIASLAPGTLIYLLTMNRDNKNEFMSYLDGIDLVSRAAQVPIYGSWDFYLGKGIVGGVITSGFSQGQRAAKMALKILSGESIENIPIDKSAPSMTAFDFNIMSKFGLKKDVIPDSAIIINEPPSLLKQLAAIPSWIIGLPLGAISLLTLILIMLKVKQRLILQANINLDKRVKDKTKELNASNNKLNTLINTLPIPVFYKNLSSEYQTCNEVFAKMILGIHKEAIIGRTLSQLSNIVPAETIESLNCKVENGKVRKGVRLYEAKIRCADGTVHDYIFHTTPMIDSDGCITGEITAMTDVSEQCIAQKKKEKLITQMEQTNSKLKTMAIMDSVTNIFNRRYISQKLTEEFRKANIFYTPLSILMLDIDHFKNVNDKFGHQFGDLVLHRVSQTIKEVIRDGDFLGRYGGEEYLLILPNTSLHNAILLAERIRSTIESLTWIKSDLTVTISGGCAEYNGQTETEFLKIADLCLYQAKTEGRNQIIANSLTELSSQADNSRHELVF